MVRLFTHYLFGNPFSDLESPYITPIGFLPIFVGLHFQILEIHTSFCVFYLNQARFYSVFSKPFQAGHFKLPT